MKKTNIESIVNYESDSVNNNVIEETVHQFNDVDSDSDVEYIGDAVFKALDSFIGPSVLPAVFSNDEPVYKKVKRFRTNRPKNWRDIAQFYRETKSVESTLKHFKMVLPPANVQLRTHAYWITTFVGRWEKDLDNVENSSRLCYRRQVIKSILS